MLSGEQYLKSQQNQSNLVNQHEISPKTTNQKLRFKLPKLYSLCGIIMVADVHPSLKNRPAVTKFQELSFR